MKLEEYADVGTHWIAFYVKKMLKLFFFFLTVLELNMLLKKIKNFLGIKT